MELIWVLLPPVLGLALGGLALFGWALRGGQFDDLEGPRWRVVYEDEEVPS
jgi:cbb3-type cytochrome oxidase maturation protein